MSDLSNLLGDVYGDHSPDAPQVRREAAAEDRAPRWEAQVSQEQPAFPEPPRFTVAEPAKPLPPIDDDLAAALSAALTEAAAPAAPAPAAVAPVMPAPVPQAPVPTAAPAPTPAPIPVAMPIAPAAVPAPVAMAPAAVAQEARFWVRGDDDIFPNKGSKKKGRK